MNQTFSIDQALLSAGLAVLTWVLARFTTFLNSKSSEIKNRNKYTQFNVYIDLAVQTVLDTIMAINQSVVSDLKTKSADGKLTEEERKVILVNAVNSVMMTLSDDVKSVLSQIYGDLPAWIETKIESEIYQSKNIMPIRSSIVTSSDINYHDIREGSSLLP